MWQRQAGDPGERTAQQQGRLRVGRRHRGSTATPASCDGTGAQRFTLTGDGTIRSGGNCLASAGGSGASVKSAACDATAASQQWSSTTTGNLKNASNDLCLDLYGGLTGARFDSWPCGSSQANQVFQLPVPQATRAVHVFTTSSGQGTCLTVHGTTSGSAVVSSACDGSAAQNWTSPGDGTLRLAGRCLDDFNSGGTGSNLILFNCTGNSNQQWSYALNGNLVNGLPSKLCAGVHGAATADGTAVELQACGHNLSSQLWTLPTLTRPDQTIQLSWAVPQAAGPGETSEVVVGPVVAEDV